MKLMKFFEKTKGSISIFLILIMLPMFTCAGLMVDGARISAARIATSGAGDLAMNAALSEYDEVLQDVYGLFAMSKTTEELEANVSRYFSNTLNNAGVLQGSDSYTRSYINSIAGMFSTDEVSFDNIVDTNAESFELLEVPSSALGSPEVLERQIVEYMKYRGPVNMGTGLLAKFKCIAETSKQTKAMEKKVDYEKKLDTVQDACQNAYDKINEFVSAAKQSKLTGDYLGTLNGDLATAKSDTKDMAAYIIAYESPSLETPYLEEDADIKKATAEKAASYKEENKNKNTYNWIKRQLKNDCGVALEKDSNGYYKVKNSSVTNVIYATSGSDLSSQVKYVQNIINNMSKYNAIYTYLPLLEDYYEDYKAELTDETAIANLEDEYAVYEGVYWRLVSSHRTAREMPGKWKSAATSEGKAASKLLYGWYSDVENLESKAQAAAAALSRVLTKVDELAASRAAWGNQVEKLSDGDIKTSMEGDYNNSAKDINREAVEDLRTILLDNKHHFTAIKGKLEKVTFYEKKICINDCSDYVNRYASSIPDYEITASNSVSDRASSVMSNYVNANMKKGITPETYTIINGKGEKQIFYKYLQNTCSETKIDKDAKADAESNRKALIEQGNGSKAADTSSVKTGSYVGSGGLSAEISAAIDALAEAEGKGESFTPSTVSSGGSDSTGCKANLSAATSLLDGLVDIGKTARDKVYLEEYFTEMFSCYTTGRGEEDKKSLSNQDMSTNQFYRSEVEYILYGMDSVSGNLNAAKASVFGVRFGLNSVYALTNSYTRTQALSAATAIAGWTGFGVPIVQTVILLAWSLAESMVDMQNLCNGEAVCIYKTEETWVLGIAGGVNEAKDIASKTVDDIFDKIEQTATDAVSSLTTEVTAYVNKTTEGVVESIQSSIMTAVERLALQIVGESDYGLTKEDVAVRVDTMLADLTASAQGDGTAQKATRKAIEFMKNTPIGSLGGNTLKDYITNTIYSTYQKAKKSGIETVTTTVDGMLTKVEDSIKETIASVISAAGDALEKKVSGLVSQGGEAAKEKVSTAIEEYMGDMSGTSSSGGSDKGSGKTSVMASLGSSLTLTYKEYMKAFMMMSIVGNEEAMLKRCAKLIQANVSQKNSKFNIAKAHTMVAVNADVTIRTTFFDVPVATGVSSSGETSYHLDFSRIGTGRQKIEYAGILGY